MLQNRSGNVETHRGVFSRVARSLGCPTQVFQKETEICRRAARLSVGKQATPNYARPNATFWSAPSPRSRGQPPQSPPPLRPGPRFCKAKQAAQAKKEREAGKKNDKFLHLTKKSDELLPSNQVEERKAFRSNQVQLSLPRKKAYNVDLLSGVMVASQSSQALPRPRLSKVLGGFRDRKKGDDSVRCCQPSMSATEQSRFIDTSSSRA